MSDHLIGNFFSQAMKWVAGENMLAWDGFEDRLRFIVQHRVAADFCSLERIGASPSHWRISSPRRSSWIVLCYFSAPAPLPPQF